MKVTPLAQGTGVPAQSDGSTGKTVTQDSRARAIAVASGHEVPRETSGDPQVDRAQASIKRIKMKTQRSTNRDDNQIIEESISPLGNNPIVDEIPNSDTNEPAQGTEETRPLSPQFAALAKAKRALQIERANLEKEKADLAQNSSFNKDEYVSKADLVSNPMRVFEAGVTYDQLTEAILNNQSGVTPEINALKAELKSLKEELTGQFVTRDQQAEQQVLADIKREAIALTAEGEQFEAIREARAQKDVVELIHRTWKKTGEVLDVTEAAELVENQLIDEALPFARIKKVQSRLMPAQEQRVAQTPTAPNPGTKVMRTLTNRDNASPIMDRRARAIAAMQGTLKKG